MCTSPASSSWVWANGKRKHGELENERGMKGDEKLMQVLRSWRSRYPAQCCIRLPYRFFVVGGCGESGSQWRSAVLLRPSACARIKSSNIPEHGELKSKRGMKGDEKVMQVL